MDPLDKALDETSAALGAYVGDFFKITALKPITAEIINRSLVRSGEEARDRTVLSAMVHKAMIYKIVTCDPVPILKEFSFPVTIPVIEP